MAVDPVALIGIFPMGWAIALGPQTMAVIAVFSIKGGVGEPQRHRAAEIFQREGRPCEAIMPGSQTGLSVIPANPGLRQLRGDFQRIARRDGAQHKSVPSSSQQAAVA